MRRITMVLLFSVLMSGMLGCGQGPKSGKGFSLPEGDIERGQEAFVALHCHACHTVAGVELPEVKPEMDIKVRLGGEVAHISTYGELLTSIVNPSHKLASGYKREDVTKDGGESKMTNYNHAMTVQQLIDLIAFLQSRYTLKPYEPTDYPLYY